MDACPVSVGVVSKCQSSRNLFPYFGGAHFTTSHLTKQLGWVASLFLPVTNQTDIEVHRKFWGGCG